MFSKRIEGELGKVKVYESQANAYTALVGGLKAQAEVYVENGKLSVENARLGVAAYQGQIEGFKADVSAQVETARANTDLYRADVNLARAQNESYQQNARREVQAVESAEARNIEISKLGIEQARVNLLAQVESLRVRTAALNFGSEKYFGLITAALNSISAVAVQSATST